MSRVGVLGTTSWGTTLGILLARRGQEVTLWARSEEEAHALTQDQENKRIAIRIVEAGDDIVIRLFNVCVICPRADASTQSAGQGGGDTTRDPHSEGRPA